MSGRGWRGVRRGLRAERSRLRSAGVRGRLRRLRGVRDLCRSRQDAHARHSARSGRRTTTLVSASCTLDRALRQGPAQAARSSPPFRAQVQAVRSIATPRSVASCTLERAPRHGLRRKRHAYHRTNPRPGRGPTLDRRYAMVKGKPTRSTAALSHGQGHARTLDGGATPRTDDKARYGTHPHTATAPATTSPRRPWPRSATRASLRRRTRPVQCDLVHPQGFAGCKRRKF